MMIPTSNVVLPISIDINRGRSYRNACFIVSRSNDALKPSKVSKVERHLKIKYLSFVGRPQALFEGNKSKPLNDSAYVITPSYAV